MGYDKEVEYAAFHLNKMYWEQYRAVVQHIRKKHKKYYSEVSTDLTERIVLLTAASAGSE